MTLAAGGAGGPWSALATSGADGLFRTPIPPGLRGTVSVTARLPGGRPSPPSLGSPRRRCPGDSPSAPRGARGRPTWRGSGGSSRIPRRGSRRPASTTRRGRRSPSPRTGRWRGSGRAPALQGTGAGSPCPPAARATASSCGSRGYLLGRRGVGGGAPGRAARGGIHPLRGGRHGGGGRPAGGAGGRPGDLPDPDQPRAAIT